MKRWLKGILIVSLGFILFACSDSSDTQSSSDTSTKSQSEGVRDNDIGLRKVDLQDEKNVKLLDYEYISSAAGESERIERSFENAPPMISHSVEGMLPITNTEGGNQCLTCHDPKSAADVGAVAVPSSHTYDLRLNKSLGEVANARFNCVLCHTPQTNALPLITNTFTPDFRNQASKNQSNLLDVLNEGVK